MAKPRKPVPPIVEDTAAIEALYSGDDLSPALSALQAEMGVSGALDAYVVVYLVLPDSGKEARIFKGSPEEHDLDKLAMRFGSGDYIVRLYVQGEDNRYHIRGNKMYPMMLDPREDARIKRERDKPESVVLAGAPAQPDNLTLAALLKESREQTLAIIAPLLQQPKNDLGSLKEIVSVIQPLLAMRAESGGMSDPVRMLGLFKTMQDIVGGGKAELPDDTPVQDKMLYDAFKLFMENMASGKAQQAVSPPVGQLTNVVNQQGGAGGTSQVQPISPEEEDMSIAVMLLLRAAAKGDDVEKWADRIYDDAPDNVLAMLELPDWFEQLVALQPEFTPHKIWLEKVRARVIVLIREDAEPEQPPAPDLHAVQK